LLVVVVVVGCWLLVVGCGCWLLVVGCGCWLLVVGCWLTSGERGLLLVSISRFTISPNARHTMAEDSALHFSHFSSENSNLTETLRFSSVTGHLIMNAIGQEKL
jgi:hypothetical protein